MSAPSLIRAKNLFTWSGMGCPVPALTYKYNESIHAGLDVGQIKMEATDLKGIVENVFALSPSP
jgi:hypothetical protein